MNSTIPKTHLFTPDDLHLMELMQIFGACEIWFESGMQENIATFDVVIRDMPPHRNFLIFTGLEEIVQGIKGWKYSEDEINYLIKHKAITQKFGKYLKKLKFSGSIHAMPEGTVFFNQEPIIRIQAPIIEANLITLFLFQVVTSNTIFSSKVIRSVIAAGPNKGIVGGGVVRAHGFEASMKNRRSAYICGTKGTGSLPAFNRKFNTPFSSPLKNAFHAVIKSFPSEIEAMRTAAKISNGNVSLMVDTYDFKKGVKNAIQVAKELKEEGKKLHGITIDSGDLLYRTKLARKMFNVAGIQNVSITVASNLDEYKIHEMNKKNIPANQFLVGTEISTVADAPKLEVVYKISQIKQGNKIRELAKFSPGKESYPGKKQVFRVCKNKKMYKDIIGLESEKLGKKILKPIIVHSKLVYKPPTLDQIRDYTKSQIELLPKKFLDINKEYSFNVEISKKLKKLFEEVKQSHCKE